MKIDIDKGKLIVLLFMGFLSLLIAAGASFAGPIPQGQDMGSIEKNAEQLKKKEAVTKKLIKEQKPPQAEIEQKGATPQAPAEGVASSQTKVLINKIIVDGVTIFSPSRIRSLVSMYEGKELSLDDFRKIADSITNEYRKNGYVTSLAFLPPQKIENNELKIAVLEGKTGSINIAGNRYFKKQLLLKYIELRKGEIFNYDTLRKDINRINEYPDRNAKVVLEKGAEQAETDVNVQVKDRLPLHATIAYNNYNSSFLGRDKYSMELKSTNFLGLDHIASAELQLGDDDRYQLYSGRYVIPLGAKHQLGGYYVHVDQKLGGTVKSLNIRGKGDIGSAYFSYKLVDDDNFILRVNPAFDYKNIQNKVLGILVSKDYMRVAKLGFDLDLMDMFRGRTLITQDFDFGIPDIMGGLKAKDPNASRAGSGGKFFKAVTNLARVQSMPYSTSLMFRGGMQLTANKLTSTEQFNIGGITTVRGYPASEYVGDRGFNATAELYIPPFFASKAVRVPLTDMKFYDAFRFVGFFDWGRAMNKNPQVGEIKSQQIYSAGPGLRFDIPGKLSISFDYGFALGQRPADGSNSQGYIETKLYF